MNRDTFINWIAQTEHIEFVADLVPPTIKSQTVPLFSFSCNLFVAGKRVFIFLLIPKRFPLQLPIFILSQYDILGFLPHIIPLVNILGSTLGSICFLEKESIYVNKEEPLAVFQASVDLAIQTLSDGISGKNHQDFREEFNVFWENNSAISKLHVLSFIEEGISPKKVLILKSQKQAIIIEEKEDIRLKQRMFFKGQNPLQKSGVYIPLLLDAPMLPPKFEESWTSPQFVNWLNPLVAKENWPIIKDILQGKRPMRFEYLILGVPRKTGPTIFVGVHFKPKKKANHPLLDATSDWGLALLRIHRLDPPSLMPRGGANVSLQKKQVLLIGCGSVGSHLALSLAKTGIGHLSLVDDDILKFENIQRFAIGFEFVNKEKVMALEEHLKKNYLHTRITSISKKLETLMEEENINLSQYDLLLSATGDPSINLYLNEFLRKKEMDVPLLIGWNEPFGIGGHALLSLPKSQGCYRCLFRERYNIASFAAKEQPKPFHRKHLGCGEVYTPYGALDSIRTSELMARLAIQCLNETTKQSQIVSWKGDPTEFTDQGFLLSTRYNNQTPNQMNDLKFDFKNLNCPHCGQAT